MLFREHVVEESSDQVTYSITARGLGPKMAHASRSPLYNQPRVPIIDRFHIMYSVQTKLCIIAIYSLLDIVPDRFFPNIRCVTVRVPDLLMFEGRETTAGLLLFIESESDHYRPIHILRL